MSTFPNFSDIESYIQTKLQNRIDNPANISSLNAWVRVTSGTGRGLYMLSNPNFNLFGAAGAIYGSANQSGTIGYDWDGNAVTPTTGQPFRPSPIISGLEIDEGQGEISRKASFSITAFSYEQMEMVTQHFLQPGFSVFIEWGWNTPDGVSGLQKLDVSSVARFQSFTRTNEIREMAKGDYDNYLGFMSGGGLSVDGDKWTINIECSGYTQLPAFLNVDDVGQHSKCPGIKSGKEYGENATKREKDTIRQTWMRVYNELPSNRQIEAVKEMGDSPSGELYDICNFINFDESAVENINKAASPSLVGRFRSRIGLGAAAVSVAGEDIQMPRGIDLITIDRYIKFDALMKIISRTNTGGIMIGNDENNVVNYKVNTSNTYCSAFKHMFSVDGSRLFIPNVYTPEFNFDIMSDNPETSVQDFLKNTIDNSVERTGGGYVEFPMRETLNTTLKDGSVINKEAHTYGKLDDLYVNFDFAKGIMETSNLSVKDALYQILNGISSAVNGMWDFQIEENISEYDNRVTELRVHEMNFSSELSSGEIDSVAQGGKTYDFVLYGNNSILTNTSLSLNIQGAMMNRIIGERLGRKLNSDTNEIPKTIWRDEENNHLTDRLEIALVDDDNNKINKDNCDEETDTTKSWWARWRQNRAKDRDDTQDEKDTKDQMIEVLLNKITLVPKVGEGGPGRLSRISGRGRAGIANTTYIASFQDKALFTAIHLDEELDRSEEHISPIMPIEFEFTVHGISGINRGNKFKVVGLPKEYNKGFFQVLSVKHSIDGMQWNTTVKGGYRQR